MRNKFLNLFRAKTETRKTQDDGPLRLELQVEPSFAPKPYPLAFQKSQNFYQPSTTPFPDPFETVKPQIDPALAASIYHSNGINLNPTYNPLRDQNVLDPQTLNAILYQQYYSPQDPNNVYGFRQNSDGSVSTYPTIRPPWPFNWFTTNNNNNNNANYQSDQQQGPIQSFFTNLAQNNPLTTFFNPQSDQPQNPFQNFISNLNPFNLFNSNNRPQQSSTPVGIQSDYVSSPSNSFSSNLDSSVFSNDQYAYQATQGGNNRPNYLAQGFNQGYINPGLGNSNSGNQGFNSLQSVNFNPGVNNPTPIYNPGLGNSNFNPAMNNPYQFSTTNRPSFNPQFSTPSNAQPYSQLYLQNPQSYPVYQNPYQSISPLTITSNPNFNQKKKTGSKTSKRKNNKNKVDVPDSESGWFQDFLDKRKEASLDVSSRKPTKKKSEEDDDEDFDDYFR